MGNDIREAWRVYPFLTAVAPAHAHESRSLDARAQCGPIKSVQVCDPDQILPPPHNLLIFRWFRRNSFLRQCIER